MGYPLVTVTSSSGILSLSQERFVSDSLENDIPESSLGYTWNIPVFYVNQGKGLRQMSLLQTIWIVMNGLQIHE